MPWLIVIPVVGLIGLTAWLYERHKKAVAAAAAAPAAPPIGMSMPLVPFGAMPMAPAPAPAPPPALRHFTIKHGAQPASSKAQGHVIHLHKGGAPVAKITPGPVGPGFPPPPPPAAPVQVPVGVPAPPFSLTYPGPGAWSSNSAYIMQYQSALKYLSWAVGQFGSATDQVVAPSLNPGTIDGQYGNATKTAVMAFQKWAGLPQDGQAGADTANALAAQVAQYAAIVAQAGPITPAPAPPGGSGKTGGNYTLQPGTTTLSASVWFFDLPPGGNQWAPALMGGSYAPAFLGNQAIVDTKGVPGIYTFAWTTPDGSSTQKMVVNFQ